LGKDEDFAAFKAAVTRLRTELPQAEVWIRSNVQRLVDSVPELDGLLHVVRFLREHPRPNLFLRELPVPVDTKFVKRQQGLLREWLDLALPPHTIRADEEHFERRYGLRYAEPHILARVLDPELERELGFPWPELSLPPGALARLPAHPAAVLVVENRVNLLTLPPVRLTLGLGALVRGGDPAPRHPLARDRARWVLGEPRCPRVRDPVLAPRNPPRHAELAHGRGHTRSVALALHARQCLGAGVGAAPDRHGTSGLRPVSPRKPPARARTPTPGGGGCRDCCLGAVDACEQGYNQMPLCEFTARHEGGVVESTGGGSGSCGTGCASIRPRGRGDRARPPAGRAGYLYPFVVAAAYTGARRAERFRARVEDFDFASRPVLLREKKRSRGKETFRTVDMTPARAAGPSAVSGTPARSVTASACTPTPQPVRPWHAPLGGPRRT
jgi:hypothetical protein